MAPAQYAKREKGQDRYESLKKTRGPVGSARRAGRCGRVDCRLRQRTGQAGQSEPQGTDHAGRGARSWRSVGTLPRRADADEDWRSRSEKRGVGKECDRTCRSGCSPIQLKKNQARTNTTKKKK